MTLTAATVKRDFLDPALEGIALNLAQERLCFDPSPEVDSLLELLNSISEREPAAAADGLVLLTQLVAKNQLEREQQRRIAGTADPLVTELRHQQLNGAQAGVSLKRVVREARGPLDYFAKAQPRALEEAAALGRLVARVPSAQLLATAVKHDLGRRRFELFERYVRLHNESGVQGGNPDPASHSGAAPDDLAAV